MQQRHLCMQMRELSISKLQLAPAKCVIMDGRCLRCNTRSDVWNAIGILMWDFRCFAEKRDLLAPKAQSSERSSSGSEDVCFHEQTQLWNSLKAGGPGTWSRSEVKHIISTSWTGLRELINIPACLTLTLTATFSADRAWRKNTPS